MLAPFAEISPRDLSRLSHAIYDHCGINLHEGKQELVQARLAKLLRQTSFSNVQDYLDRVLDHPDSQEFSDLVDSLSTNLTSFFRESEHFDYLGRQFLPELLADAPKHSTPRIRCWSAACSTGEEPYTIAMVVQDALESLGLLADVKILATDISHRVLRVAREGLYHRSRVGPIPPMLRGRYMRPSPRDPDSLECTDSLAALVRFAHLNLINPWPFTGPFNFIFCRNVMIYFDKPTQQRLIERFFDVLTPGGLLFTGHSESLTGIRHRFQYAQPTIYRKP